MHTVTEHRVTYWAVHGDRWCNVDGLISAELLRKWEQAGWRIVTRVTHTEREVFGELEHRFDVE